MAYRKTLSLVTIFLIVSFSSARASTLYAGAGQSFAGVISEDEFYNGANDWATALYFGITFERLSMEMFLREFELENEHEEDGVTYNLTVKNLNYGFGLRYELLPFLDLLSGVNTQNVSTTWESSRADKELTDVIDEHYFSWYLGGGFKFRFGESFLFRVDGVYYKGSIDFGLFGIDIALIYNALIF